MNDSKDIAPRSKLYSLEPLGRGSASIESATGYTIRLSEAHNFYVWVLVDKIIRPMFASTYLNENKSSDLLGIESRSINGTKGWAKEFISIIQILTGRNDLESSTFLKWGEILPTKYLLRKYKAWCPNCLSDWNKSKREMYEPLMWVLTPINICPIHEAPLVNTCSNCGKNQPQLDRYSCIGYCSRCGKRLGSTTSIATKSDERKTFNKDWELWKVNAVSKMIECPTELVKEFTPSIISELVRLLISHYGNTTNLAQIMGLHFRTVFSWSNQIHLPQLEYLLQLCYLAGITPLSLFINGLPKSLPDTTQIIFNHPSPDAKRTGKFDYEIIRVALEKAANSDEYPPRSMNSIAKELGYDLGFLKRNYPEPYNQIKNRYIDFRRKRKEENMLKIKALMRKAAINLILADIYPTYPRIGHEINRLGEYGAILRYEFARALFDEVIAELFSPEGELKISLTAVSYSN